MDSSLSSKSAPKGFSWYGLAFTIVSGANLLFILFDFTYLRFRDVYFDYLPSVQKLYDPLKGIEPHRFTIEYLSEFDKLAAALEVRAPDKEAQAALKQLRDSMTTKSRNMIDDSPFTTAHKDGVLELIKKRMREHGREDSAKIAFARFFSETNLSADDPARLLREVAFFNERIRPLMSRNFFRHIAEDGEPVDMFYRCDLGFVAFFWLDFLFRWFFAFRRKELRKWYLFPIRRWYELFNLVSPHHDAWFRLGRFIGFGFRLREFGFMPGGGILPDIIHDNAAVIADEISDTVMINILSQTQAMIRSQKPGELLNSSLGRELVKARELIESQLDIVAARVLPQLTKDITDMVIFSINRAMEPWLVSPLGFAVRIGLINVNAGIRDGLKAALNDPEGVEKMKGILRKSVQAGMIELVRSENLAHLQGKSTEVIEEMKRWIVEESAD